MQFRDRKGRRWTPFLAVALVAVAAVGCQDDGTEASSDPLFAPGGKPKLQDVTVQIGPDNANGVAVNGGWFVAAYNLGSGLEATGFTDCDAASPCSTVLTVPTGTYAFIAFPGRRASFPGYVPLPPDEDSWECIVAGCGDPTSAAVVTRLVDGEIGSAPLARWTFEDGFVVEISNKPPDPVILVPPTAVLQSIQYDDLEQFNPDEGNYYNDQPRSTSVVFPLCWTQAPYASWGYVIPSDGNGALPAVPLTGAVANPADLPMPDYDGFPNPGAETCDAYTDLTGGLDFFQFVYELDFSGTPDANGETLLSTYATNDSPTESTITQYTRPLLCDAQTGKYLDEQEGDGDKIDFLSPFVNGFQADVDPDLVLHPIPDAVAGWYSQQVLLDGTSAVLTIKNFDGTTKYSLSAKYTCDAYGCALDGVNSNAPDISGFEINFRPAEGANEGDGLIETSWSWVGIPFPVDGVNGNVVTIEVKAPGDNAPEASRNDATSSDFAIPYSDTCVDTNDGRWALG